MGHTSIAPLFQRERGPQTTAAPTWLALLPAAGAAARRPRWSETSCSRHTLAGLKYHSQCHTHVLTCVLVQTAWISALLRLLEMNRIVRCGQCAHGTQSWLRRAAEGRVGRTVWQRRAVVGGGTWLAAQALCDGGEQGSAGADGSGRARLPQVDRTGQFLRSGRCTCWSAGGGCRFQPGIGATVPDLHKALPGQAWGQRTWVRFHCVFRLLGAAQGCLRGHSHTPLPPGKLRGAPVVADVCTCLAGSWGPRLPHHVGSAPWGPAPGQSPSGQVLSSSACIHRQAAARGTCNSAPCSRGVPGRHSFLPVSQAPP